MFRRFLSYPTSSPSLHSTSRISRVISPNRTMSHVYPTNPQSPTDLLSALPEKFEQARQSGQLFYFPSQAKDVYSKGKRQTHVQFNLRCCPALQDKAKAKSEALAAVRKDTSPEAKRQKRDDQTDRSDDSGDKQNTQEPFKPPYVPELFLGCLNGLEDEPGMSILLNKYAVLPEHMLLCPQKYEPQSLPPTPPQLALAYLILVAAARHPTRPRRLLAFYNGGKGAGASQKWRHLQFIEVNGRAPIEEWTDNIHFDRQDEPILHPEVSHLHIIHPLGNLKSIPYPPTPEQSSQLIDELAPALMKSLDIAIDAVRRGNGDKNGGWNLLMTLDHLHLIPRSQPNFTVSGLDEPVELNSLGYAGMMLVKSEQEEKILIDAVGEAGLMRVLESCGVPRSWGEEAITALTAHIGTNEPL